MQLKDTFKDSEIVLDIGGNTIESIEFFNSDGKAIEDPERLTMRNHSYKIKNNSSSYYIQVLFKKQAYFPISAYSLERFYRLESRVLFLNGLFYGFVAIVLLINLILYIALKDKSFLTYLIFLALTILAITDFDGLMGLYTSFRLRFWISTLLHFIVPASAAIFASTILGHHRSRPRSVIITGLLLILSAICYTSFIISGDYLFSALGDIIGLVIVSYYMYLGILELPKQRFAKFTVFGYCLIWISAILYMIPLNFGISEPSVTIQTVKMGSILEMLVLTYSIVYRMKLLQKENRRFSALTKNHLQLISELEDQIQTIDIEQRAQLPEEKVLEIAISNNLTAREIDVLLELISGLANREIAEKLSISVNTVKYHTKNIYEKLGVKKRGELSSKLFLAK